MSTGASACHSFANWALIVSDISCIRIVLSVLNWEVSTRVHCSIWITVPAASRSKRTSGFSTRPCDSHGHTMAVEMFIWVGYINCTPAPARVGTVVMSPHIDMRILAGTDDVFPIRSYRSWDLATRVPKPWWKDWSQTSSKLKNPELPHKPIQLHKARECPLY